MNSVKTVIKKKYTPLLQHHLQFHAHFANWPTKGHCIFRIGQGGKKATVPSKEKKAGGVVIVHFLSLRWTAQYIMIWLRGQIAQTYSWSNQYSLEWPPTVIHCLLVSRSHMSLKKIVSILYKFSSKQFWNIPKAGTKHPAANSSPKARLPFKWHHQKEKRLKWIAQEQSNKVNEMDREGINPYTMLCLKFIFCLSEVLQFYV